MSARTITEQTARIAVKHAESLRLLQMLAYYEWLERHALSWDQIAGVRLAKSLRICPRPSDRKVDYKLQDGSTRILPWPPFHDDVIYNKSRI